MRRSPPTANSIPATVILNLLGAITTNFKEMCHLFTSAGRVARTEGDAPTGVADRGCVGELPARFSVGDGDCRLAGLVDAGLEHRTRERCRAGG